MGVGLAALAGAIFSLGLMISGMSDPLKVTNFLDIFGTFDPTLMTVLGGAVAVSLVGFTLIRRKRPLFAARFFGPTAGGVDAPLILGAVLFGIGWGLSGLCPGPALVAVILRPLDMAPFILGLVIGTLAVRWRKA